MTYPTGGILTGEEAKRLDSLDSFALMDTPADSRLDSLTQLAARLIGTPIATVTLVDHERQWLKSAVGLQQGVSAPRDISFCAHVVRHPNQPMVVEDASQDPRFADNPFVTGTPHIRFYAGIPLVDEAGLALGALCVIDTKPRQISDALLDRLADIGAGVMSALYLQRSNAALQKSEVFARQILAASTSCIDVLDLGGRILFTNPTSREALELAPDETIDGTPWEEQWPEAEQPRIRDQIEAARAGRRTSLTLFCPTNDGTPKWWDSSISPILDPAGNPTQILSSCRDVTTAKMERDALTQVLSQLSAVLESTTDSVIVLDADWTITYLNRNAGTLLGATAKLVGTTLWDAFPDVAGGDFELNCCRALTAQAPQIFEDFLPTRGLWLEVHAYPTPRGLSIFFRDVTERHRTQAQLLQLARHDSLTGLANRFVFHEHITKLAQRPGGFAVLLIDLDHFKDVNDSFGHPTGDALLQQAAMRLNASVRQADAVARVGGDEFAVLLTGVRHQQNADALAARIVSAFAAPFTVDGITLFCGASIGIALSTPSSRDPDRLLKDSDLALYAAKAGGRGTYRFFTADMAQRAAARQAMTSRLRGTLSRDEMNVHYQPVINLPSGQIVGFEALLRWTCPVGGLMLPGDFIPVAEETGLIAPIGRFVLTTACHQAAAWPNPIWIAVNLSPVQFRDPGLVQAVADALKQSGLAPKRLELEITETALLRDDDQTLSVLHALRSLGVRIALDDFGTGYASLSYLRSFPFDKIKIDRVFIRDLPESVQSAAIVRAVTTMGRSLSLTITAEGVETQEQLESVRLQGCAEAQGFYFSRAIPAEEATRLLQATPDSTYWRKTERAPPTDRVRNRHI